MEKHFPVPTYPLHLSINPIVDRSVATILREEKQFSIRAALSPSAKDIPQISTTADPGETC